MTPTDPGVEAEFAFEFEGRYRPLLLALGIMPKTTGFRVVDGKATARFGPWSCNFLLSNVANVSTTGPYRGYRAIGPRGSFEDGGATFGSTTAGGIFIEFSKPVPALDLTGTLKHRNLTVTLQDREAAAQRLRDLAGLA